MDYSVVQKAIREKYKKQSDFAKALGVDPATLSAKLNGKRDWKADEIARACELLDISAIDLYKCFFSEKGCTNATD